MKSSVAFLLLCIPVTSFSQTAPAPSPTPPAAQPATRPAAQGQSADDMLRQLLPPARQKPVPIEPLPDEKSVDPGVRAPAPPPPPGMLREGTYIVNRVGRLTRTADNQAEFTFESDGSSLKDPPMLILPNTKLTDMETAVRRLSRDPRFRITGMVTEYNNRNYILVEKMIVVRDESDAPAARK